MDNPSQQSQYFEDTSIVLDKDYNVSTHIQQVQQPQCSKSTLIKKSQKISIYKQSIQTQVSNQQSQKQLLMEITLPRIMNYSPPLIQQLEKIHNDTTIVEVSPLQINSQKNLNIFVFIKSPLILIIVNHEGAQTVDQKYFSNYHILSQIFPQKEYVLGLYSDRHIISIYTPVNNNQYCLHSNDKQIMTSKSDLQLISKLKNTIKSTQLSNSKQHKQMMIGHKIVLIIHNFQKIIYDTMQMSINDVKIFQCSLQKICSIYQPKYPLKYYLILFEKLQNIKNCNLSFQQKLKIVQYCWIQHIDIIAVSHKLQQLDNSDSIQQTYECLQKLEQINYRLLEHDPVNQTIIFYWMISLTNSQRNSICQKLIQKLEKFSVSILQINDESLLQSSNSNQNQIKYFQSFLNSQELFKNSRFAYVIINLSFTEEMLEIIIDNVNKIKPQNIHYQLYLVTPQIQNAYIFEQQDLSCQISYFFSLESIIYSILEALKVNSEDGDCNQIQKMAKILKFIASNYCNIDINKITKKNMGNITIIEYPSLIQINWKEYDQGFKQEIIDELKILLQKSYKQVLNEEPLLWYFLQNIEQVNINEVFLDIGQYVLNHTFQMLPYIDLLQDSQ